MHETKPDVSCLLCRSRSIIVQDELSGREIIALWRASGREFPQEAMRPIREDSRVPLYRCNECGFRFYDVNQAGSGKFYEELMAGGYYAGDRPEFQFALKLALQHGAKSILDVGGGDGAFLDLAKAKGLQTYGVELNEAAAAKAAAKGHRMISKFLSDITLDEVNGGVDALTLHQVVEHVADPVGFVRDSARLVKENGLLVIAVPNEYRICGLLPLEPANWPPHHVSRWRKKDLRTLIKKADLEVVSEGSDVLYGAAFEPFIPLHNRLADAIGRPRHCIDVRGAKLLSLFYRKLGFKHFFPRLGLSIYIAGRKPAR